jgi:hypothetical protein
VVGPSLSFLFSSVERTIIGDIYLGLLEQLVFPQLKIKKENATALVFQQDGVPPHLSLQAGLVLNAGFKDPWI